MTSPVPFVEIWRGAFLECTHFGQAVVCDDSGQIVHAWGDPDAVVLPRSSAKMIQALPLITSGAADAVGLTPKQLALSCASHHGAAIHTETVNAWLGTLGLNDDDFRCGPQDPSNRAAHEKLIRNNAAPCQAHNECSGKHVGFLTLNKHLGAGAEYVDRDHPVQKACLDAFERVTDQTSPGFGIDGCSAPNFACTLHGMARAMAHYAASPAGSAETRLHEAMRLHPEMVAGEGGACTELMRAMDGKVAIKTGAEGYYVAILPEKKMGVALKITDGAGRGRDCAIAAILVKLGVLDPNHPAARAVMNAPIVNRAGLQVGMVKPASALH
ncbi:MAG: asparaginase [Sulfitobacter sp.]